MRKVGHSKNFEERINGFENVFSDAAEERIQYP